MTASTFRSEWVQERAGRCAPRRHAATRVAAAIMLCLLLVGCRGKPAADSAGRPDSSAGVATETTAEWFTDEAASTGLDFVHVNGMSGGFHFPEIMGAGAAVLDYDEDGDLDVYLVQGQVLGPGKTLADALVPPPRRSLPLRGRLYRNDLQIRPDGTRTVRFTDVTTASGIEARGYGMGVAAGDVTNDGCVDLYLTHVGPNQLFRNNCDGTFTDVSRQSGVADPGWGVSAAFADYDRDGWLDLYVGNYVEYSVEADRSCISVTGGRDYCPPRVYPAQRDRLYRNKGNGTFADVTTTALLGREFGPALGVVTADVDGDGWQDIYVANDGEANQLWMNLRDGTFRNRAPLAGVAFNADGQPEGSMGVDAGDFNNDGSEDLFVTNLTGETVTLYVNNGSGMFEDQTARVGLGAPSLPYTGFGAAWIDVDNDSWLDLLTVNGTIVQHQDEEASDPFPYAQPKQLFRNVGGRFEDVTVRAGAVFAQPTVGRGAAFGDIDNDGGMDVVVTSTNGPVQLLMNRVRSGHHWLGLRLLGGAATPRDMLGARVAIVRGDGTTLWRRARADGSYASANDPRVLVGLGASAAAPRVRVIWPSGRAEQWRDVAIDRWTTLREGTGTAANR